VKRLYAAALSALVAAALLAQPQSGQAGRPSEVVARVYGCPAEDSCRIDYRRDRQGRGVWLVIRQTP
jgi:hypothetical protein